MCEQDYTLKEDNMRLLQIGDNVINERYFYGLMSIDMDNICSIEAQYDVNGVLNGQVIHSYTVDKDRRSQHTEELQEAMRKILFSEASAIA